jgi:preprotein translocase subunit SecD
MRLRKKGGFLQMRGNNGIKFFLVIALIAVLTYICFAGNLFGLKVKGAMDIVPGIDINGGIDATLYAVTDDNRKPTQKDLDTAKVIIGKRLDKEGILDRDLTTDLANGRIYIRIPYAKGETNFDPEATMAKLGKTALLTFQEVDETKRDSNGKPTYDASKVILGGTDVIDATPQKNPDNGGMQVDLKFNAAGQQKFADATGRLVGKQIAIFMDDQFISEAQVQSHITSGDARITLGTSSDSVATAEAKDLADTIRSGALPFKLETKQINSISPLLGRGALDITIKAFIVAFLLIAFFMIFYYRLPGLVASIALFSGNNDAACDLLAEHHDDDIRSGRSCVGCRHGRRCERHHI